MKRPTHFLDERGGRSYIIIFLICVFSFRITNGQTYFSGGAATNGLAGAVCSLDDDDHALQSIASSAYAERIKLSSHYQNHYLIPQVNTLSAIALFPMKTWVIGFAGEKMGPSHYQELKTSLSLAHRIEHTALGLRINWLQLAIDGFQTQHAFTLEFGGIVRFSPKLNFGGTLYNFSLSRFDRQLIPVILRCGLSGKPRSSIILSIELEKNNYEALSLKWGMSYAIHPKFKTSIGYSFPSSKAHLGLSFNHRNIGLMYSMSWHVRLGISQHFSIAFSIFKSKS